MNIRTIKDFNELQKEEPTVLVLGYFDGIHLGIKPFLNVHERLQMRRGLTVTVLTYPESPRLAFSRFTPELLLHLTSQEQRYLYWRKMVWINWL